MRISAHNSLCSTHAYHLHINLALMPLMGNVVISKKFLRARKIMVMHSNERGECCPRTLVDRKRKRYDNAVDVVVHLHDRPILVPNIRHLRVRAHVQLDDEPRTTIKQSVGEEFR